ncbi:hypothetical protein ABVT39_023561 [Epinephelus coioides]
MACHCPRPVPDDRSRDPTSDTKLLWKFSAAGTSIPSYYKNGPVASLPLHQIRIQGQAGGVGYTPRLQIVVVPRKVEWETGKFGCLTQVSQGDGSHKLEYNPYREKKYKTAITVGKIIVLIRTKETDEQPEIPRTSEAKQGFMGAKQGKMEKGVLTPVEVVMRQHPSRVKRIQRCVSKWHKRTSGKNRWPMEGTFNLACCDEVESELRHIEARDTKASCKKKNKRAKEREVLGWFRQAGGRKQIVQLEEKKKEHQDQEEVMPTAPPLPTPPLPPYPQKPAQPIIGQYPLRDSKAMEMEGQLQGRLTVTLTKNTKQEAKKKKQQGPRKKLPLETAPPSETDSTDGSSDDDRDTEATDFELYTKELNGKRGRDAEQPTDPETAELASAEGTPPKGRRAPPLAQKGNGKSRRLREDGYKSLHSSYSSLPMKKSAHHSRCSSLPLEESRSPTAVSRRKKEEGRVPQSRPLSALEERQLQEWLEWKAECRRVRQEEERQGTATIDPTSYPGQKMKDEPSDGGGHGLREDAPRGASLAGTQDQQLFQHLEGIAQRAEDRVLRMAQELEKLEERLEEDRASQQKQREPRVSSTTEHITLKLQGTMETDRARSEEAQDTDKGQMTDGGSQDRVGMKLRSGKRVGNLLVDLWNEESEGSHMRPFVTKTGGRKQYKPWPFMDMIGLAERLPVLTDGADKWIMALEETTADIQLALGDIKAILMWQHEGVIINLYIRGSLTDNATLGYGPRTHIKGKQTSLEIFTDIRLSAAIGNNVYDDESFGHYRSWVWQQLRAHYPAKRGPSKPEGETMADDECPSKFLHSFQKRWKEETGEAWNANKTTQSLFKMMVKKPMPEDVQRRLKGVVGLMKMDWPLFSEHIIHHVELYRKDKKKMEEDSKQLANKLTQLQLGELSKLVKKEKDRTNVQAPMVMANQTAPQAVQPQTPLQPAPTDPNTAGGDNSANATHHHYYYQQKTPRGSGNQQPPRGQGRVGPRGDTTFRGGWKGGRNYISGNQHIYQQTAPNQHPGPPDMGTGYPGANPAPPDNLCWGCGQPGHIRSQCSSNPWEGPAQNWPNTEQGRPCHMMNQSYLEGSRFPLSTSSIKTIGFSGKSQVIPLTEPVPMLVAGKTICAPLLYSAHTPVNLLGRDILCPLKAKIMCTQDGLYLDFPDDPPQNIMSQLPLGTTEKQQALAYWLQLAPEESHLKQAWTEWEVWIRLDYDTAHTPTLPLHCTLMYDKDLTHVDYQECWDAVINKKPCLITSEDVFLVPEGVAAAVRLPEELSGWFQVPNSTSHVTLLVAEGYESHHLGPMVRRALQVQEWMPTKNKYIHI